MDNKQPPKEKAQLMVLEYTPLVLGIKMAKACALHQVNDVISLLLESFPSSNELPYYKDVRAEIEKFF
jgi:hypothetical protein